MVSVYRRRFWEILADDAFWTHLLTREILDVGCPFWITDRMHVARAIDGWSEHITREYVDDIHEYVEDKGDYP